jgi:hypothetical protein
LIGGLDDRQFLDAVAVAMIKPEPLLIVAAGAVGLARRH